MCPTSDLTLVERGLCGDLPEGDFKVGELCVVAAFGEVGPFLPVSPPIKEDIDIPPLGPKPGNSLGPG